MHKRALMIIACVAACPAACSTRNQARPAPTSPQERAERIAKIGTLTEQDRDALLEKLSKERSDLEGQLLTQLGNAKTKEEKFAIVFLYGT